MATIKSPLGDINSSLGNLTFSTWKGQNVVKQKATTYNDANTPAQQEQRAKFAILAGLSRILGPILRIGFRNAATDKTEQNVFMSDNMEALSYANGVVTVDYTQLTISKGSVKPPQGFILGIPSVAGISQVKWDNNTDGVSGLADDKPYLAVLNDDKSEAYTLPVGGTRSAGGAGTNVQLPASTSGKLLVGYLFFKRADSTLTSASAYDKAN